MIDVPEKTTVQTVVGGTVVFRKGNKFGGDSLAGKREHFRHRLMACITDEDLDAVAEALIKQARSGDQWAIKEFLDRATGTANRDDTLSVKVEHEFSGTDELRRHLSGFAQRVQARLLAGCGEPG